MRKAGNIGFVVDAAAIRNDILIPRYYDPDIDDLLSDLERSHDVVAVSTLIADGDLRMASGDYVGKMHYGTGNIPYIRTSDLRNWEIDGSPKHGLSETVYESYREKQDVAPGDLLLVHEGTYLIGTVCLITQFDTTMVYQHHIAKLRAIPGGRLNPYLLLALFGSTVVQRQIRAKQLTADTIDSIVGRIDEIKLPIPRGTRKDRITDQVKSAVENRAVSRVMLAKGMRRMDEVLRGGVLEPLSESRVEEDDRSLLFLRGGLQSFEAFTIESAAVRDDVLIPKYYEPGERRELERLTKECDLVSLQELMDDGVIQLDTGHEVGRINYGTGDVPFVRTSDFGNWELKTDVKQGVAESVRAEFSEKQNAKANDLLIVRDGTYLVGASTLIQEEDLPLLYCGGIYRLRIVDPGRLDPLLMFALLNTDVVRRQIQNRRFTRDVIDTLGHRLKEIVLPLPRSEAVRRGIADFFRGHIRRRVDARAAILRAFQDVIGITSETTTLSEDDM